MYLFRLVRLSVPVIFFLMTVSAHGQIMNIERKRVAFDTSGFFGSTELSFAGSKNTKSTINLYAAGFLEYKSKSHRDFWLFLTEFSLISGDGEKFSNAGFAHLRYNHKLSDNSPVRWEVFSQVQYNGLTKINVRALAGTGPRFKLTEYEEAKFYWGVAYMYEYQELLDPIVYQRHHRLSSYFTFTLAPVETVTFISTTYAQPLLTDFSDYRIMNETNLILDITKKLSLRVTFHYNYNAAPPEGVPTNTYFFKNGLALQF